MTSALTLYPYQKRWMHDRSRFKIGMFARQTGKTFTTCGEITDRIYESELRGQRDRWVILSRGERQAREAIETGIKPWAKSYGLAAKGLAEPSYYEDTLRFGQTSYRSLEVEWPNGSRVTALPANPDTARGFSSNVFLDEFAFHQDSRAIWKALFPVISNGWDLRVTSTPNGKGNKFYELMTADEETTPWSRHEVDIYKAVAQGLPRDVEELRAGLADEDAWAQEYELKWLDEASSWLSHDLISECEHPHAGIPENYRGGPCFVGVDIAARNDLFVIWVDEMVGDVAWNREIIARKRISFAEQDALLAGVFHRYRVVRLGMDQTGMGEKPVEDATRRYGTSRVEGVLFSAAAKLDMATAFKMRFEDRRTRIAEGDPLLRADLNAVKKTVGPTGIARLNADRDSTGHADRFWAGALAASVAAGGDYQPYAYRPVHPGTDSFDRPVPVRDQRPIRTTAGFRARPGAW